MDAKLLYELKLELDRIYISGIRFAKNNSRITKILPLLEKYVDEDVANLDLVLNLKQLIQPGLCECVDVLSKIYTSLNYLLHLHGKVIVAGEEKMEQESVFNLNVITTPQHSFLELKPLVDALLGVGKDRLEIIRKAREEKLFDDFRTYPHLNRALADEQTEIVELVENIIRDDLRDKMLPFLLNGFECNDNDDNLKRLALLFDLQYSGLNELLDEILESNPQKRLKEMACLCLAKLKTEKAERKLYGLYVNALNNKSKGDIELFVKALSQTELQYTFNDALRQVKDVFNNLLVANKKADVDHFNNLRLGISILKVKDRSNVYDFFFEILFHEGYNDIINKKKHAFAKPAKEVSYAIIDTIQCLDTALVMAFYEKVIDNMIESEWKLPFYKIYLDICVHKGDSDERIYEKFAPHYQNKSINVEDIAMLCVIDGAGNASASVDRRWIDRLYETLEQIDEEENIEILLQVLNVLESASSDRYNQELIKAGEKTKKHLLEITSMIMKRDIENKCEIVYSLVKHCHDQGTARSNALRQLPRATYWSEFPKEYVAKFRELKNAPRAIVAKITE